MSGLGWHFLASPPTDKVPFLCGSLWLSLGPMVASPLLFLKGKCFTVPGWSYFHRMSGQGTHLTYHQQVVQVSSVRQPPSDLRPSSGCCCWPRGCSKWKNNHLDFGLLQQQGGQITSKLKVKYEPGTGNNFTFTTVFLFLPRVGYCKKEGTCVKNFQETLINTLLHIRWRNSYWRQPCLVLKAVRLPPLFPLGLACTARVWEDISCDNIER